MLQLYKGRLEGCLMKLKNLIEERIVYFDGAYGSMFIDSGIPSHYNMSLLSISKPDMVLELHKKYSEAGADIITSNTFSANSIRLLGSGFTTEYIIKKSVELAKKAAPDKFTALDIAPSGLITQPLNDIKFSELYNIFKEQVKAGAEAGADLILIESMYDLKEARAAVIAAKENCSLPVYCTMTFKDNFQTFSNTGIIEMVYALQMGIEGLGINCVDPILALKIIDGILRYSKVPLIVQPSLGLPKFTEEKYKYAFDERVYSEYAIQLIKKGTRIFGGCCGTTPAHMKAAIEATYKLPSVKSFPQKATVACSNSKSIFIGDISKIIGERINPSGNKLIEEALQNGNKGIILESAREQAEAGAHILDINVSTDDVIEKSILPEVVSEIQKVLDIPLMIDSLNPEAIEAAVRVYNGRAIINSVNGTQVSMDRILPIAKKYGSLLVAMTIDENGIPKRAEGRVKIAEKIIDKAKLYGIAEEDIIIDCIVLSSGTSQEEVLESLKALKMIKTRYDCKTILGISNISYGMPLRDAINSTYFAMALNSGLNAAIINPLSDRMIETYLSYNLLSNKDYYGKELISYFKNKRKKL